MEYRTYKDTDCRPSLLGMGCMRLPKTEDGKIDRERAFAIIDRAFKGGITYFDVANPYHDGNAEPFIGEALSRYPRDSFTLATKMPAWKVETLDEAKALFEGQLEKCKVDYFDFYLCHALDRENFDKQERLGIYDYLAEMKKQGYIRRLGFSFHDTPDVLREICQAHPWDFAQLQINYLDWTAQKAKEQYDILVEYGLPCVVMEPVRGGALAKLCSEAEAVLKQAAPDRSIASWAIRFAASLPNVMTVLSGMTLPEQMEDNLATMSPFEPLSDAERKALAKALEIDRQAQRIPCTGCRYCMPCPFGVDIPALFKAYNECAIDRMPGRFLKASAQIPASARPDQCRACGKCAAACPQHIAIPEKMAELKALEEKLRKED